MSAHTSLGVLVASFQRGMGLLLASVFLPAQGSEVIRATACLALLTLGWTLVYGMGITTLVAAGKGSKGISLDG